MDQISFSAIFTPFAEQMLIVYFIKQTVLFCSFDGFSVGQSTPLISLYL